MSNLEPADYRKHWDSILPGVRSALEHQREGLRSEDVYFELRSNRAVLFVCDDGFVVLKEIHNDSTGEKDLLVWLAYSHSKKSVLDQYEPELADIARNAGCSGMQFVSTRRGYERALPEGWEPMHTRWRRRLK